MRPVDGLKWRLVSTELSKEEDSDKHKNKGASESEIGTESARTVAWLFITRRAVRQSYPLVFSHLFVRIPYPATTSLTHWSSHPFFSLEYSESSSLFDCPKAHCDETEETCYERPNVPFSSKISLSSPFFFKPRIVSCRSRNRFLPFRYFFLLLSLSLCHFHFFSCITPQRGIESSRFSCQACIYVYILRIYKQSRARGRARI